MTRDEQCRELLRGLVGDEPPLQGRDLDLCWYCFCMLEFEEHMADCQWLVAKKYLAEEEQSDA